VALTVLVLVSMTDIAVRTGIGHVSVHPVRAEGNMNQNKFHPYGGHHRVGRRIDHRDALRTDIGAVGTDGNIIGKSPKFIEPMLSDASSGLNAIAG
jgi:hypothetical protein